MPQRRRSSLRLCDPDPAPPLQPPPRRRLVPCPLRLRGCRRRRGRPVSMPVLRGRPAPPPSYLRRRGRRVASARAQPRQLAARTPSTTPCWQVCVCMQTARRVRRRRMSAVAVRRCDVVCLRCAAHAARLVVAALLLLARVATLPPSAFLSVTRCHRLIISSLHGRSSMMCRATLTHAQSLVEFCFCNALCTTRRPYMLTCHVTCNMCMYIPRTHARPRARPRAQSPPTETCAFVARHRTGHRGSGRGCAPCCAQSGEHETDRAPGG